MRALIFIAVALLAGCAAPVQSPSSTANVPGTVAAQVRATLTAVAPTATPRPVATPTPSGPAIGQQIFLYAKASDGSVAQIVEVVRSPADLAAYLKVQQAKDIIGLVELEGANRAFGVETGRRVLVLDSRPDISMLRVRIIDGPKQPLDGWVPDVWTVTQLPADFVPTPTVSPR